MAVAGVMEQAATSALFFSGIHAIADGPSGVEGSVHSDALIVVDGNGTVITGEGDASAETAIHLHLISALDAGAVLHTHSLTATVLSRIHSASGSIRLEGWEMLKGSKELQPMKPRLSFRLWLTIRTCPGWCKRCRLVCRSTFQGYWLQGMDCMPGAKV